MVRDSLLFFGEAEPIIKLLMLCDNNNSVNDQVCWDKKLGKNAWQNYSNVQRFCYLRVARFYRRFAGFLVYFIALSVAFTMRPGSDPRAVLYNSTDGNSSILANPCYMLVADNATDDVNATLQSTLYCTIDYSVLELIWHFEW